MPDYSKSKVYKVWSPSTDLTYYGSTTQSLSRRMVQHRSNHKTRRSLKSSEVIDVGDAIIVLVEACPCNNKEELSAKEAYYIKRYACTNKKVPGRTQAEANRVHRQANIEAVREYDRAHSKAYYHSNKEKVSTKRKEKTNCPCGSTYRRSDKSQHMKTVKHQTWAAAN